MSRDNWQIASQDRIIAFETAPSVGGQLTDHCRKPRYYMPAIWLCVEVDDVLFELVRHLGHSLRKDVCGSLRRCFERRRSRKLQKKVIAPAHAKGNPAQFVAEKPEE